MASTCKHIVHEREISKLNFDFKTQYIFNTSLLNKYYVTSDYSGCRYMAEI